MNEIWLITGIPGAGKSTVARLLAATAERAVQIEGDALQRFIVSGSVWPGDEPADEAERQGRLNERNQCLLACSFCEAGFMTVIDWVVVTRDHFQSYRQQLKGLDLYFVVLAPGQEAARTRDRERADPLWRKVNGDPWTYLEEKMVRELRDMGLWIDNSARSPQQTVEEILRRKAEAKV